MDVVVRAVAMYLLLLVVLRVTTRRVIRTATPLDMVLIFVLGGLAVQAIIGGDRSISAAVVAIVSFAGTHLAISLAKLRWPVVGRLTDGPPVVLYRDGRWNEGQLRAMRLQQENVLAEMRQNGLHNMEQVDAVVFEHNGGISIIQKTQAS
jgi:uncharacterized membrane protein YcaP (DUF421 family)